MNKPQSIRSDQSDSSAAIEHVWKEAVEREILELLGNTAPGTLLAGVAGNAVETFHAGVAAIIERFSKDEARRDRIVSIFEDLLYSEQGYREVHDIRSFHSVQADSLAYWLENIVPRGILERHRSNPVVVPLALLTIVSA